MCLHVRHRASYGRRRFVFLLNVLVESMIDTDTCLSERYSSQAKEIEILLIVPA